ncbi:hypothetical protein IGK71_000143 [Enterococcus sp. DIV0343]|jgi:hypothetical protein
MFKNYTINQTTLPLDMEQYIPETDVAFEVLFIDGTKIEADANKFSFVWRKATNRYEAALDKQSNEFYQTLYKEEPTKSIYAKSKRIIYQENKDMKPITAFFKSEIVFLKQMQMPHLCE